jgi:hypothetical protein
MAEQRVVFLNTIGGLGDTLPMPLLIQRYKKFHPDSTTILYDSLFVHHYCEPFPGIDEIHRASEHILPDYVPGWVLQFDRSLPRTGGVALSEVRPTHVVSTHHAHGRKLSLGVPTIEMDFHTQLAKIVRDGFHCFDVRLRPEHAARVDNVIHELTRDGRMLIGLQTRGGSPYNALMLPRKQYVLDLTAIAASLVRKYSARILVCGDDRLQSEEHYVRGDWVALDALIPNFYYKLEIMKRTRLYLAASSGFSIMVNLMRSPEQIPAIQVYTNPATILGATFKMLYADYENEGGGTGVEILSTFRHPTLRGFLFDTPHTPEKVLAFVAQFLP